MEGADKSTELWRQLIKSVLADAFLSTVPMACTYLNTGIAIFQFSVVPFGIKEYLWLFLITEDD